MRTLPQCFSSVLPFETRISDRHGKNLISCNKSEKKDLKQSRLPSVLAQRSNLQVGADQKMAVMEAGSMVLSPNGVPHKEIGVKELLPFGRGSHELDDGNGIGIIKFLGGKNLFITGATGFLAKILIEKILRTVPTVGKIFVLIKAKNKELAMKRMKTEIIKADIFKGLQQTHGKSYEGFILSKLVPVAGNVCDKDLGLDIESAGAIARDVDIIVNSAANTTFDERYDVAVEINTRGPCRILSFARRCLKLKLFLQISTAYVNGQRQGKVMERPFGKGECIERDGSFSEPQTLDVEGEIRLALESRKSLEDISIAQNMKELGLERAKRFGWQDTYVFTKAMGEMMIDNMRGDIPVVILRPSIIESTYKDPFPGWIQGNRMMDPIVLYYGKGQLTGFLADPNVVLDVVPADMVVNATLAAIARHGRIRKSDINIYQITSSTVNPLVFEHLAKMFYEHFNRRPYMDSNGNPIHVSSMKLFDSMDDFSAHLWKDAIQRSGLTTLHSTNHKLAQKLETMCRKSVEQAQYLANIYEPYTFYGGRFDNSNTERLMEVMSEEEKRVFGFDVRGINWKNYISNIHIPGLRRHVLKGRGMC